MGKTNKVKSFSFRYFTLLFRSNRSLMISCCGCTHDIVSLHQELHFVASADCDRCRFGCHRRMYLHVIATNAPLLAIGTFKSIASTTRKEFQNTVYTDGEAVTRPPFCQFAVIFPEFSSLLIQSFSVSGPQTVLVRRLFHHWMYFAVRI